MREFSALALVLCLILTGCCLLYIQIEQRRSLEQEPPAITAPPTTGSTASTSGTTAPPTTGTTAPPTTGTTAPPTTGTTAPPTTGTTAPPTTGTTAPVTPPVELALQGQYGFAYDAASGEFLYTHGDLYADCAPASITKIFTAYVALQILSPDTQVTVGVEIGRIDFYSSIANLALGDVLTVEQLVAGMMLPSGNDAAYTLAVACGRALAQDPSLSVDDALARFMAEVNACAQAIGLKNTYFVTPDGDDAENHHSCAYDIMVMALLAYENPTIRYYAKLSEYSFTAPNGKVFSWKSSNMLLYPQSDYYNPLAVGLKTGTTSKAGNCLVSLFEVDGQLICIGVLGCETSNQRYEDTWLLFHHATA